MVMTLAAYRLAWNNHLSAPVPLNPFIQYGHWFQQQAVPDIDPRKVTRVEDDSAGFRVTLEDGEVWKSRRVIVAAGIAAFAWRPSEFAGLPAARSEERRVGKECRGGWARGDEEKRGGETKV